MGDAEEPNSALLRELALLRQRVAELEALNCARKPAAGPQRDERHFELLFDQAPLPYQSLDEADRLLEVNPAWLALLRYRREEVIGRPFSDLLTPASQARFAECFPRFRAAGEAHGIEFDLRCGDGSLRTVSFEGRVSTDERGCFRQTHCICVDVTERREAVEALRASEQEKAVILDSLAEMVAYQDLDQRIIWANRTAAHSIGQTPEQLRGRFCYELWQQRDTPCLFCPAHATLASGQPHEAETNTPDGRWFFLRTSAVFDSHGAVSGIVEVGLDITERRRAEERVQRLLDQQLIINRLALTLGTATDLDAIYHTIHQHVVSLMDASAFIVAAYSAERREFTAKYVLSDGEVLEVKRFPPVPLEPTGQGTQSQVVHSGEPVYLSDLRATLRRSQSQHTIMEDGAVVAGPPPDAERSSQSALFVPMKVRGETVGVLQVQSTRLDAYSPDDIALLAGLANVAAVAIQNATLHTETNQRAERLAVVNRIARAVGSILRVDDLLETVYREMTGIFQSDAFLIALYDEPTQELDFRLQIEDQVRTPPERWPLGQGLMSHVVATGQPLLIRGDPDESYPEPILWGSGPDTPSWLGAPMRIGDKVTGAISVQSYRAHAYDLDDQALLCTIADQVAVAIENARLYEALEKELRERQRLEEQLLQAQKMEAIGRLAGGVAHDFNNLLTVINGYSQLILNSLAPDAPLRQEVGEIAQAGDRAAGLTRQLLAFSRRQLMQMRLIDLNQVLEGMARMLRRIIGEDVRLVMGLARPLHCVKADPGQIEQVVMNLAANARDAMPNGGALTIETANISLDDAYVASHLDVQLGDYALLVISDTGHGLSPEVKEHLFEPFFTTKGIGQGTGLGLATVYGIVKQLGGNIQAYSEEGLGTTFKMYLPRCSDAPAPAPSTELASLPRGHETILVVEDEDKVRQLALRLLQRLGYRAIEAPNLASALEIVRSGQPPIDLALLDVVMPEASGPQVAALLRQAQPELRVLYMSGYTDRAIAHHGLVEAGATLLQKPFTVEQLAQRVRHALDGAPSSSPARIG